MSKINKFICCLFFMVFSTLIKASPILELTNLIGKVETIQANFTQTVKNSIGKSINRSDGLMTLKNPKLFRWEIKNPEPSLVVSDGIKIWNYDELLQQVVIKKVTSDISNSILSIILTGNINALNKDFIIEKIGEDYFKIKPKQKESSFIDLKLKFIDKKLNFISLTDQLGQVSDFKFSNIILNKYVSNDKFKFVPPKDVDIIGE